MLRSSNQPVNDSSKSQLARRGVSVEAVFGWGPAILGVVAIAWSAVNPGPSFVSSLVLPFGFLTTLAVSVALHELAHYGVGTVLGQEPFYVAIGYGKPVFEWRLKSVTWSVRTFPAAGYVVPLSSKGRAADIAMIGAGPAMNLVLVGLGACGLWGAVGWEDWFAIPLFQLLLTNMMLAGVSILPKRFTMEGRELANDGLQILQILRGFSWERATGSSADWQTTIDSIGAEHLLAVYRNKLCNPSISRDERLLLLDAFATAVLMYKANEFLPEADKYSIELLEAKPNEWTVKGTRGSILIELGRYDEGKHLLLECYENSPSTFDKGIGAACLALAAVQQVEMALASEWLEKARAADRGCPIIKRVEAILAAEKTRQIDPNN